MRGQFITVEGIEGVGKTTQLDTIEALLTANSKTVVRTREPGGTPLAEEIRELFLRPRDENVPADCETLLMFAARSEHLNSKIFPTLDAGNWVLSDRFTDATFAYQGGGRGSSLERIAQLEQWVQGDFRPNFTLLLDAPADIALQRALARSAPDRMESEALPFFERAREIYLDRAAAAPHRYCVIDAAQDLHTVTRTVESAVLRFLNENSNA